MGWVRCGLGTPSSVLSLPTPSEASGAIARFNTDLTENLLSAVAEFSASQAEGTPTPANPIPIVGVDKVNITRTGKNLLSMKIYDGGSYNPAVGTQWNLTESTNEFTRNGNAYSITTSSTWRYFTLLMPLKSGINYYMHIERASTGSDAVSYVYLDKDFKVLAVTNNTQTPYTTDSALNPPANSAYYALVFTNRSTANCTITITNLYIIVGSTATDFEPYNGTTALINLGGTYYGGSVDAVTGKITLTHKKYVIDENSNITWRTSSNTATFDVDAYTKYRYGGDLLLCDTLQAVNVAGLDALSDNQIGMLNNSGDTTYSRIPFKVENITSKADMQTWLASHNITIVVNLATPIVVYASNTAEIPTIVGDNQVYADTGDVAVKYFETVGHKI